MGHSTNEVTEIYTHLAAYDTDINMTSTWATPFLLTVAISSSTRERATQGTVTGLDLLAASGQDEVLLPTLTSLSLREDAAPREWRTFRL